MDQDVGLKKEIIDPVVKREQSLPTVYNRSVGVLK
jgi:hypothetical protein